VLPPPSRSLLVIQSVTFIDSTVLLQAHAAVTSADCPACGINSNQVHDHYQRRPLDLPWRGWTVRLTLTVRRFRCSNTTWKVIVEGG
jgi:transposase